jgi:hypothetical protein
MHSTDIIIAVFYHWNVVISFDQVLTNVKSERTSRRAHRRI